MKAGLLLTVSLFSQAKGKSFVGVSGDSRASSGTGLVGVESVFAGAGDVGVDAHEFLHSKPDILRCACQQSHHSLNKKAPRR